MAVKHSYCVELHSDILVRGTFNSMLTIVLSIAVVGSLKDPWVQTNSLKTRVKSNAPYFSRTLFIYYLGDFSTAHTHTPFQWA